MQNLAVARQIETSSQQPAMNDIAAYRDVFAGITPWSGIAPKGYLVDFLGTKIDMNFINMWTDPTVAATDREAGTTLPIMGDGEINEHWFEAANWMLAVREARGSFTAVSLGAHYGAQLTGPVAALRKLNPMPFKIVAVEAGPENCKWIRKHFEDNNISENESWIVPMAMGANNDPIFFPVGSPGSGGNNCITTNEVHARRNYVKQLSKGKQAAQALESLLLNNTTGLMTNLIPGMDTKAEIKLVSAVTLEDVLGPFERVDFLESDIQRSEVVAFPPYMDLLKRKVRRIHMGTHGADAHKMLHDLFVRDGWEIVFSFEGETLFEGALGKFRTNDGILSVVNPALAY